MINQLKGCYLWVGALMALSVGCSLSTFDRVSCAVDDECGNGVCQEDGYCSAPIRSAKPELNVGMLYVGPVGDHGWTKAHDDGRIYVLENSSNISIEESPSVNPNNAEQVMSDFIADGKNVIVATSFDFINAAQSLAINNPDVDFLVTSSFNSGPNLSGYFGRMYQIMYQAGWLAGKQTQTNRIGIVGPVVIPETVRHVNAFTRGVRAANPEATVSVEWVNQWFAPEDSAIAAERLIRDGGVDIVFGHTDTTSAIEKATEIYVERQDNGDNRPIYTIGYDNPDSCTVVPGVNATCMTSAYWNWGPLLTRVLEEIQTGTWVPEDVPWEQMSGSPDQSTAYLADMSPALVSTTIRGQVEGLVPMMTADTEAARMLPFEGPVIDWEGNQRVAAGEYPSDEELLRMCWFVEGVVTVGNRFVAAEVPANCPGDR